MIKLIQNLGLDCPGGEGKFGFNSYDLLTFAVLSFNIVSNVITNTNKNENNNNNNDNQVSKIITELHQVFVQLDLALLKSLGKLGNTCKGLSTRLGFSDLLPRSFQV